MQTFEPELTPLQQQVLDLLGVPDTAYTADRHLNTTRVGGQIRPEKCGTSILSPAPVFIERLGLRLRR